MAKQMKYTDTKTGFTYPQSYWHIAQVNLNKHMEGGKVLFHGYATQADRNIATSKKGAAAALIIGTKTYSFDSDHYNQYFTHNILDANGVNGYRQAYLLADNTLDTEMDGAFVSFFNNTVDI